MNTVMTMDEAHESMRQMRQVLMLSVCLKQKLYRRLMKIRNIRRALIRALLSGERVIPARIVYHSKH